MEDPDDDVLANAEELCAICREPKIEPVFLPCSHSFCNGCLENLVAYQRQRWARCCPLCRVPIDEEDEMESEYESDADSIMYVDYFVEGNDDDSNDSTDVGEHIYYDSDMSDESVDAVWVMLEDGRYELVEGTYEQEGEEEDGEELGEEEEEEEGAEEDGDELGEEEEGAIEVEDDDEDEDEDEDDEDDEEEGEEQRE